MKTYIVGGAVRDKLLGLPVSDRDHVVVGTSVETMLATGFKPVGRDFPVFLHPTTHEEYALARTERKIAPGYAGFVFHAEPDVTLEDDLARRDLTINAMAEDEATHELVDPFDGQRDLERRVFRHVGTAFVEDPVRILRVARFAARFANFSVADETLVLMREMVARGEVDALVPERVWREVARGLMEQKPSRMIDVLRDAHALVRVAPEVDALFEKPSDASAGTATLAAIDRAAVMEVALATRFAALVHAVGASDIASLCARLGVPVACRELALLFAREMAMLVNASPSAEQQVLLFERCDAFRRPTRFEELLLTLRAVTGGDEATMRIAPALARGLARARAVDPGAIARHEDGDPSRIAIALHAARVIALQG